MGALAIQRCDSSHAALLLCARAPHEHQPVTRNGAYGAGGQSDRSQMFEVRWRCPMPSLDGAVEPAERLDCHPGRRRSSSSVGRSARSAGVMSQGVTAEFTIVRVRVRCIGRGHLAKVGTYAWTTPTSVAGQGCSGPSSSQRGAASHSGSGVPSLLMDQRARVWRPHLPLLAHSQGAAFGWSTSASFRSPSPDLLSEQPHFGGLVSPAAGTGLEVTGSS
jgi:hypothetical protein